MEAQQIDNLFIAPHNGVVMTYYDMLEHIRKRHDQEFNHSIMGLTTGVRMGLILNEPNQVANPIIKSNLGLLIVHLGLHISAFEYGF